MNELLFVSCFSFLAAAGLICWYFNTKGSDPILDLIKYIKRKKKKRVILPEPTDKIDYSTIDVYKLIMDCEHTIDGYDIKEENGRIEFQIGSNKIELDIREQEVFIHNGFAHYTFYKRSPRFDKVVDMLKSKIKQSKEEQRNKVLKSLIHESN